MIVFCDGGHLGDSTLPLSNRKITLRDFCPNKYTIRSASIDDEMEDLVDNSIDLEV